MNFNQDLFVTDRFRGPTYIRWEAIASIQLDVQMFEYIDDVRTQVSGVRIYLLISDASGDARAFTNGPVEVDVVGREADALRALIKQRMGSFSGNIVMNSAE